MAKDGDKGTGYNFGTFQGVFTPSILTIIGVVMYLRFGWMLGNVGLARALFIVTIGNAITLLTGLSISALATNMRVKGGGAYFIISRTLGPEAGAALGLPLALSQAVAVSFYVAGFAEALVGSQLPVVSGWDPRIVGFATLAILAVVASISADIALKSQYFIMAAIAFSLVSFFLGGTPEGLAPPASAPAPLGFWPVFAVFFPAVTGILSGVGMSGDLKNPAKSIPLGTLAAIVTGYVIYMAVPIALNFMVSDSATLRADTMILQKCARWQLPILFGVWAATLSSAVGSFLCAPRVLKELSRDGILPSFFGKGFGKSDDPVPASIFCFGVAALGIGLGDINVLAPILTLFNLSTYGLLNLCAALGEMLKNPSWRPTFRVKSYLSIAGFAGCFAAMFMISPGWTMVALFCEGVIFWLANRFTPHVGRDDMRTAICAALVRLSMRRLEKKAHSEHNWRPNLLVFTKLPPEARFFEWARAFSGGRSLVTIAATLPKTADKAKLTDTITENLESAAAVRRAAAGAKLEAYVKLLPAAEPWVGMAEIVRTYGFGPLVPNTVLMTLPDAADVGGFAEFLLLLVKCRRNVIVLKYRSDLAGDGQAGNGPIDIWWRGNNLNAGLMLAIAVLLQHGGGTDFPKRRLRLNMIIHRRTLAEAESSMDEFLFDSRVNAEPRVMESGGRPFADVIRENSEDAALSLVGLRKPEPDEAEADYAEYFRALVSSLDGVSPVAFVLAGEEVDFRSLFARARTKKRKAGRYPE
jgi:amino acid transporter